MIRFKDISKIYPTGKVFEGVTFHIEPGELVILTGPSGSGKTTLAKLMIRETDPTSGSIFIDGDDISKLKHRHIHTLRKKISVIFQDYKIIPDKTVAENIRLALEVVGTPHSEHSARISKLLKLVGIKPKQDLFPLQLSGGELQRAAIARAIAVEPSIIFADEPTGNLDADTSKQIFSLLKKINQTGTTVIIATHTPEFINFSNRHIHLENATIKNKKINKKKKINK